MNISFTSTYDIPFDRYKKTKRPIIEKIVMENAIYYDFSNGHARASMTKSEDGNFENILSQNHINIYKKFKKHCVESKDLVQYTNDCIKNGEYEQFGMQKKKIK